MTKKELVNDVVLKFYYYRDFDEKPVFDVPYKVSYLLSQSGLMDDPMDIMIDGFCFSTVFDKIIEKGADIKNLI